MADIVDLSSHLISLPAGAPPLYQVPNAGMSVLQDVLNATWNQAIALEATHSAKVAAVADDLETSDAPAITAPTAVASPSLIAPSVEIPETADDYIAQYREQYQEMMEELSTRFQAFRANHFPLETVGFSAAQAWLNDAISSSNGGIPAAVYDQVFEDDRSRVLNDASRATDAVMATFASRRFPLPPGQAAAAVSEIQQKAQAEIGAASRNMAKLSLESMRVAIERLLTIRQTADAAAIDYIKTLAIAPAESIKVSNQQSTLISAAADFYRAEIAAADVSSKVAQFNAGLAVDVAAKNQASQLSMIDMRIKALLSEAQAIAQMATSLYNNLNVSTSLSANGGSQLSGSSEY